ncbi:Formamidopyrimidine-DNA glycosylase [Sesamum angolense]|uniref:Formamidopyrimidine-DNA glycosylase n=1 Tax=Sesamum angolense TaxID=2727404 RepID=A0AAE1WL80_9LAMI|nr:Formamidopyrimidine-DNA glycosylase [Sesamum angolense]
MKSTVADDSKVIDGVSPKDFEAALVGKTIVAAHRKGKNMWLQLDSPPFPSFQFGMAGAVYIKGVAVTNKAVSGVWLLIRISRSAVKDTDEWPFQVFQKLYSGIGNWMADEVLYQVTEKAIEVGADSSQFPSNWIFHSREKKPGKAFVDGKKIEFITAVAGYTTAYVPELQKLTGNQAVKEAGKPSKKTAVGNSNGDDESGDEDEPRKAKAVEGRKTEKQGAKNPPARSKAKGLGETKGQRRQTKGRTAPAKEKHEENDHDTISSSGVIMRMNMKS